MRSYPRFADVVVIGGGIAGVSVAREARRRGLGVLLVERDDLASGTSSRSTKLLHGGLRYLEHGHVRLVREALRDRETTARLAPHLASPLPFAVVAPSALEGARVRFGVALYDLLAGRHPLPQGTGIPPGDLARLAPGLDARRVAGTLFYDRQTDDARLTVALARDAALRGATIFGRAGATEILVTAGRVHGVRILDGLTGERRDVDAGVVVNAAGPWADEVRAMAGLAERALRTTRGTHLVLPDLGLGAALLLRGRRPGHRLFAVPWRGVTLFGTTDDDDGEPSSVGPRREDVALLLGEARRHFPAAGLCGASVMSAFAGLRPLVRDRGDSLAVSREHRIADERGMLSVLGGKLTTWRTIAASAVDRAVRSLGRGGPPTAERDDEPLPGGRRFPEDDPRLRVVPPDVARSLVATYGSEAGDVVVGAGDGGLDRLDDRGPEILGQIDFAVRREMALGVSDVVFRRIPIGHDPSRIRSVAPIVARRMAALLGWSSRREADELREALRVAGDSASSGLDPTLDSRLSTLGS